MPQIPLPISFSVPVLVIMVIIVLALAFWSRYNTVGPDEVLIITGSFLGNNNVFTDEAGR